jgi:hypothetical protein
MGCRVDNPPNANKVIKNVIFTFNRLCPNPGLSNGKTFRRIYSGWAITIKGLGSKIIQFFVKNY